MLRQSVTFDLIDTSDEKKFAANSNPFDIENFRIFFQPDKIFMNPVSKKDWPYWNRVF